MQLKIISLKIKQNLLRWYQDNARPLPWRQSRDPYPIWISETMLQQTTTTAVRPYFLNFLKNFPNLQSLAQAKESQVLKAWAGLGYYSRARNLHKAAQMFVKNDGIPSTYQELLEYPGLGPYTARAVSSLAFGQQVGVLDGNVIRVLTRFHHIAEEWWKTKARQHLQTQADQWVKGVCSATMNQALMELGATICTPQSPTCMLCPLQSHCLAYKEDLIAELPRRKTRKAREMWLWEPQIHRQNGHIAITKDHRLPFLKGQWVLPGVARLIPSRPRQYHFRHSITHHDIFVTLTPELPKLKKSSPHCKWVKEADIQQWIPASLIQKALQHGKN